MVFCLVQLQGSQPGLLGKFMCIGDTAEFTTCSKSHAVHFVRVRQLAKQTRCSRKNTNGCMIIENEDRGRERQGERETRCFV